MTVAQHITRAQQRNEFAALSNIYRLLARLWLCEADGPLLRQLRSPPLRDSFVASGMALPAGDDENTIEQLAIEYCQLFVGPADHLPPFQSVWQNGQFQGAPTSSMQQFIDLVDFDADALPNGLMLDHFAVQLDVMGTIVGRLVSVDDIASVRCPENEVARTFFARHLAWSFSMLRVAADRTESEFYGSIVAYTDRFLTSERRFWIG